MKPGFRDVPLSVSHRRKLCGVVADDWSSSRPVQVWPASGLARSIGMTTLNSLNIAWMNHLSDTTVCICGSCGWDAVSIVIVEPRPLLTLTRMLRFKE